MRRFKGLLKSLNAVWFGSGLFLILAIAQPVAVAQDLVAQEAALNVIADFANRMCKDVPLDGGEEKISISGGAKVELNKLIKKLVDIGIEGAVKYENSKYEGVLQENLAKALKDSSDCKLEILRELKGQLLGIEPKRDDPLYLYEYDEVEEIRKRLSEKNAPPEIVETLVSAYLIGHFFTEVARYGEDYKSYKTPKILGFEYTATPSAVYLDEQGRRVRNIRGSKRRPGEAVISLPDETYMWEKGDWVNLQTIQESNN